MIKLYSYYRSSAAYRVRISLHLKAVDWTCIPVNLLKNEQLTKSYQNLNPQNVVPTLSVDEISITQSLAIIEWLDEQYPTSLLLPESLLGKAQVRSLAYQIAMDIHPLNNLKVTKYLKSKMGLDESQKILWYQHWIKQGFTALELSLQQVNSDGKFCFEGKVSLADVCLIPQVYNAQRFECNLNDYPLIQSISAHCNTLTAFMKSAPEMQIDCPN